MQKMLDDCLDGFAVCKDKGRDGMVKLLSDVEIKLGLRRVLKCH